MPDTDQLKNYLNKCVRCGQCRSVCPVFKTTGEEGYAPRGKVFIASLLMSGDPAQPDEARHYLSLCLQCHRCSKECPSGVPVHKIISRGRKLVSTPRQHFVYDRILASPSLKSRTTRLLQVVEKAGFKEFACRLGILPAWIKKMTFGERPTIQEFTPSRGTNRGKAVYFPGCAATHLMPHIATATVQLLSAHGWNVVKPANLTCCGFPHTAAGSDKVKELQEINFKILVDIKPDVIVTSCPTCNLAVKEMLEGRSNTIPVMDITELLDAAKMEYDVRAIPVKVAYHKPCHFSGPAPKNLLKGLPGVEVVPWEQEDTCCGGGGTFMFQNPDLSLQILKPKIDALRETGASLVATGCPACIIQIRRGLGNSAAKVVHPAEILARTLTGQPHE